MDERQPQKEASPDFTGNLGIPWHVGRIALLSIVNGGFVSENTSESGEKDY